MTIENAYKLIGKQCMYARLRAHISQSTVADELNMTQKNISNFENGNNNSMIIFAHYLTYMLREDDIKAIKSIVRRYINGEKTE